MPESTDLLIDALHPAAPQLPPPPESEDLHWLAIARQYATRSVDPINRSGCVLVRGGRFLLASCDTLPGAVRSSMARRRHRATRDGMLLAAERAAVAQAAAAGVSLQNCCAYLWPTFTDAASAALLIEAGAVVLSTPNFHLPARLEHDLQLVKQMAAEAGVLLRVVDCDPLLEGRRG